MNRPRILLVDDHPVALDRFTRMLQGEFEVAGTASTGLGGVEAVLDLKPDVVTLDITLTDIDGLDVARRIRRAGSSTQIVFLTIHADSDYVEAALKIGGGGRSWSGGGGGGGGRRRYFSKWASHCGGRRL